jgi:hypothetical protein
MRVLVPTSPATETQRSATPGLPAGCKRPSLTYGESMDRHSSNSAFLKLVFQRAWRFAFLSWILALAVAFATPGAAAQGKSAGSAGLGYEVNGSEADVLDVVKAVADDTIIHGTYVYEHDKILKGAEAAQSSAYFGAWTGPGRAFYKVLKGAVAPRHFKDSNDAGTISVRYVVEPQGDSKTHLWIVAVFVEDASRKASPSDGTVESSEYKEIQDRLREIQAQEQQTAELVRKRQEEDEQRVALLQQSRDETAALDSAESNVKDLEARLHALRQQVEVRVISEGTELKSAPFHSAAKMLSLRAGSELVILIVTPSWYGVETPDGHRGWLLREQVEALP